MSLPCSCINNIKTNLMFQCRESITLLRSTWHYLSPSHLVWGLMALIVLQIQFRQDITVTWALLNNAISLAYTEHYPARLSSSTLKQKKMSLQSYSSVNNGDMIGDFKLYLRDLIENLQQSTLDVFGYKLPCFQRSGAWNEINQENNCIAQLVMIVSHAHTHAHRHTHKHANTNSSAPIISACSSSHHEDANP